MAAGHPRVSFELDLYSTLQRHYDFDADYVKRKPLASGIKFWAVGQALAVERQLSLYADGAHSNEGAFPQFYFFDCQSCHRRISDEPNAALTAEANPGRPLPPLVRRLLPTARPHFRPGSPLARPGSRRAR